MKNAAKLAILIIAVTITTLLASCGGMDCHENLSRDECYNTCNQIKYTSAEYNAATEECCCIGW